MKNQKSQPSDLPWFSMREMILFPLTPLDSHEFRRLPPLLIIQRIVRPLQEIDGISVFNKRFKRQISGVLRGLV